MEHISSVLIDQKIEFIDNYILASNAAEGSKYDANANVCSKNLATLETEINKDVNIAINRRLMRNKISELFSEKLAQLQQLSF